VIEQQLNRCECPFSRMTVGTLIVKAPVCSRQVNPTRDIRKYGSFILVCNGVNIGLYLLLLFLDSRLSNVSLMLGCCKSV
jgi:hypothetical protein